jgi:hypothetical protein
MFAIKFMGLFHMFLANVIFMKRGRLVMSASISKHDANRVKLQKLSCVEVLIRSIISFYFLNCCQNRSSI